MRRAISQRGTWGWRTTVADVPDETLGASGLFETLRTYHGTVFALDAHLDRLAASAKTLGLALPTPRRQLARAIHTMGRALPDGDAVIRAMIVLGSRPRGHSRCVVMGRRLRPYPRRWYTRGVAVTTAIAQRFSPATILPQAKHLDLLPGVLAHLERARRTTELIYRTHDGGVAEGTVSNLCVITKEARLVSAPPACGVLAGVTCHAVFDLAQPLRLPTHWAPLTRHDVWNAAEAFLTNTTFEILPVVQYDGRVIGTGRPGPWTRQLHAAFQAYVQEQTHRHAD